MKKHNLYQITYKKENGEVSERPVYVLQVPTDLYLCMDLTDLDLEQVKLQLEAATTSFNEKLKEHGLYERFRNFKTDRILSSTRIEL